MDERQEIRSRLSEILETYCIIGTCALIMYLLGERSSPLHCGQNPLLSGRKEPAPSARRGFADHPK
ncbi:MAG: hypothetical protein EWV55_17760 [Microcystis viridis Mv_BB_P_19951000_S69]|uniref:Uncharacterized protein n=2 Tax=Microcystis TaxID=1125 RepID=A0A552H571_MICVR|nr:hypothetical protein GQR42_06590 [Microcystis aeruginosa FD4]TRU66309.1 MAG: hypothetical protein EWV77_24645 [Microcystis viridis Mv_BB_P_19951000_S68D]TRU71096.1 MAG: hypothetical protein EWV55_17760 [Microcystis viridis Mv_BB_P_19951000_S69]TRU71331.1 MAG: hypothetical protein EWV47_17175 [Microcystis viridis Mv_BB_P_19951000_S68]TRU90331.1 MAG: hypothetical protein EWV46_01745 [Microcystis viridis Mv_BB_P_19951000_S69D]